MKPIAIDRYTFSMEEVVAAILPNVRHRCEVELRVDLQGYVVIDIARLGGEPAMQPPPAEATLKSEPQRQHTEPPGANLERPIGPAEAEARALCEQPLFRVFLDVKTAEAAHRILATRCKVKALPELDATRSSPLNLRYVVEEFEAWKIT